MLITVGSTFLIQALPAPLVGRCSGSVDSASAPALGSRRCPPSRFSCHWWRSRCPVRRKSESTSYLCQDNIGYKHCEALFCIPDIYTTRKGLKETVKLKLILKREKTVDQKSVWDITQILGMSCMLHIVCTSGFITQQAVLRRMCEQPCLTQCPSSVANTSFPSLIFPETWLTLSLLPRNGWRRGEREEEEGEGGWWGYKQKEGERKRHTRIHTVYKLQLRWREILWFITRNFSL